MSTARTDDDPPPVFDTEEQAADWMWTEVDDPYTSDYRFAFDDDPAACAEFSRIARQGCCGDFDAVVTVAGRRATIGCNYGH